ncbi:hypothetical protein [Pseudomonas sp. Y24-6]|uniref:hypothetical protein n=1 Tax=Pseudomonas sp. Y24-6 TaxID=2750013 RepID=UPI001CE1F262|nr:hypothetical protein [Pseudomonas sp. Y24-6]MCA4965904.1 hypothetical protein [Pseudomonas sp. Y24-6]
MSRITVVIENSTHGIRLGMSLAGGRVTSASLGDHSDLLETAKKLQRALFYYNQMPEAERLAIEREAALIIAKLEAA